MISAKKIGLGCVIAITSTILALIYPDVFFNLNSYLFKGTGDGLKNYYNIAYHIKFDQTYGTFSGFNYPYGEYLMFVDCHPLLANVLKFFSNNIVDISAYTVGILNFLMFFSFILCGVFVYLILLDFSLPVGLSVLASIGITTLSSNALLWQFGHYALSYSFFFPLCWYLMLLYYKGTNKRLHSVLIGLTIALFYFTHVYLGFILFLFVFFSFLLIAVLERKSISISLLWDFLIQLVIPMLVFVFVLKFFDRHEGRVDLPLVKDYMASFFTVFTPHHSYIKPLYSLFFKLDNTDALWWGRVGSYIGLSTNLILLFALGKFVVRLTKKKTSETRNKLSSKQYIYGVSSILILLFSMGIPFAYAFEFLLPNAVKQMVALGRFSWPFYFVITVLTTVYLYKKLARHLAYILVAFSAVLLFSEGLSNHLVLREKISTSANVYSNKEIAKIGLEEVDFSPYQAILPLPFYQVGCAPHNYSNEDNVKELTTQLSFMSGLPIMGAMLSRGSKLESRNILSLLQPSYYPKDGDMLNDKPILIALAKGELHSNEQEILAKGSIVGETESLKLFRINKEELTAYQVPEELLGKFSNGKNFKTSFLEDSLFMSNRNFITESFDTLQSPKTYRGSGALPLKKTEANMVFESTGHTLIPNTNYEVSFWYYNYLVEQTFNTVHIYVKNINGDVTFSKYFDPTRCNNYDNHWALNRQIVPIKEAKDVIYVHSKGKDVYSSEVYFDEIILKVAGEDTYEIFHYCFLY